MNRLLTRTPERGFSLVELLVVMVILGLVMTVIYSLYLSTQRTAYTSEEVVEVQQNLRVALDQAARDIRMAGFLLTSDPVSPAKKEELTIQTATASNRFARINSDFTIIATDTSATFQVASEEMLNNFRTGEYIRILRPRDGCQPMDTAKCGDGTSSTLRITARAVNAGPPETYTISVGSFTAPPVGNVSNFSAGDLVVQVPAPGTAHPNQIRYFLADDPTSADPAIRLLVRNGTGTGDQVVAEKITGLEFRYILTDGSEVTLATAADELSADQRKELAAVRVLLTGATDVTKTGQANFSGVKERAVETIVRLRNK